MKDLAANAYRHSIVFLKEMAKYEKTHGRKNVEPSWGDDYRDVLVIVPVLEKLEVSAPFFVGFCPLERAPQITDTEVLRLTVL